MEFAETQYTARFFTSMVQQGEVCIMEEWNESDFQNHVSNVEYNKRQYKIQKDMVRNIEFEDEIQNGFNNGFKDGIKIGMDQGRELAKKMLNTK